MFGAASPLSFGHSEGHRGQCKQKREAGMDKGERGFKGARSSGER